MKKALTKFGKVALQFLVLILPFAAISASQYCRLWAGQPEEPEGFEAYAERMRREKYHKQ